MTNEEINNALMSRLQTLTPPSGIANLPILWENEEVDPNAWPSPPFLIVQSLRWAPVRQTHDNRHILMGQLQITVVDREGGYAGRSIRIADAVSAHFPSGLFLGKVEIRARAQISSGYNDGPYWRTPVLIPWRVLD